MQKTNTQKSCDSVPLNIHTAICYMTVSDLGRGVPGALNFGRKSAKTARVLIIRMCIRDAYARAQAHTHTFRHAQDLILSHKILSYVN